MAIGPKRERPKRERPKRERPKRERPKRERAEASRALRLDSAVHHLDHVHQHLSPRPRVPSATSVGVFRRRCGTAAAPTRSRFSVDALKWRAMKTKIGRPSTSNPPLYLCARTRVPRATLGGKRDVARCVVRHGTNIGRLVAHIRRRRACPVTSAHAKNAAQRHGAWAGASKMGVP